jgi:MFS family permease
VSARSPKSRSRLSRWSLTSLRANAWVLRTECARYQKHVISLLFQSVQNRTHARIQGVGYAVINIVGVELLRRIHKANCLSSPLRSKDQAVPDTWNAVLPCPSQLFAPEPGFLCCRLRSAKKPRTHLSAPGQKPQTALSLWRPLRASTFRNLMIADVASDMGTFMQSVAAAWLMVSMHASPLYVALTQTASALPFFLFALPAGAIGDIVDRRKLILFTEIWMAAIAILLAGMTLGGVLTPILLLLLTFALSVGDAIESPTWRAVLPELVSNEDLPAAAALNGIEFNIARAIGPALGGIIIAVASAGTALLANAASFLWVIFVVARWKRPVNNRTTLPETISGATMAALRYVRYSPAIRILILRSGVLIFFASAFLALLPSVAHEVSHSAIGYGFLLGCFGLGALLGAVAMQRLRTRWSSEALVSGGVLVFGATTMATGSFRALPILCIVMLIGGAAWILFISVFNVLILNYAPDWVRARVLAVSMMVIQGAMAAGSAVWGGLATKAGIHGALMLAGLATVLSTLTALVWKLPASSVDLTPWIDWQLPMILRQYPGPADLGPIIVTVEYRVDADNVAVFLEAINGYGRIRRRDGAYRWGIYRDMEDPDRYLETFLVDSWAEHLRQHERSTRADREVTERLLSYTRGAPTVHHLAYVAEAPKIEGLV